jgi:predicted dehydrogenase
VVAPTNVYDPGEHGLRPTAFRHARRVDRPATTKGETMSQVTRRRFLEGSAAGLATAVLARAASAAQETPPSEKVRVGLVGCGGMGLGDLETFFLNPEVDCPVVCDVDDSHIASAVKLVEEQRGHAPETAKDFRRVIERNDVDAIVVATPDHWHALPAVLACQAGKDVYVEKPLGKTIEEGRAMREAAKQNNRVVQMGTQWRSGQHFREAVEFIKSGKLGKIRQVRAWAYLDWVGGLGSPPDGEPPAGVDYDMWLGPAPQRPFNPNRFHFNFRWYWDYAGGLMTDWGVHLLNIALWAMGPEAPRNVYCSGGKRVVEDNTETPDTQIAVYDFPSYTLIWEHQMLGGVGIGGRPHGLAFSGSEGTLILDAGSWEIVPEPKRNSLQPVKNEAGPDPRPAHVRNFLDCMKSREQPVENLEVGNFVSTVAHLGNLALRTGSLVAWDSQEEKVVGNEQAQQLARADYRQPWTLPYAR